MRASAPNSLEWKGGGFSVFRAIRYVGQTHVERCGQATFSSHVDVKGEVAPGQTRNSKLLQRLLRSAVVKPALPERSSLLRTRVGWTTSGRYLIDQAGDTRSWSRGSWAQVHTGGSRQSLNNTSPSPKSARRHTSDLTLGFMVTLDTFRKWGEVKLPKKLAWLAWN